MSKAFNCSFVDQGGRRQQVNLEVTEYKAAADLGLTLPQYLATKYPTDESKYGTVFEQMMAHAGLFLTEDRAHGIRPPTISQVLDGGYQVNMSAITRPDGQQALTPSGRLLFPAMILELVEHELREDTTAYTAVFQRLVANTMNITSPRYDQPIINLSGPRSARSRPIAQLAEPPRMLSITLSEITKRMPVFAIGLEISDEAARASTLDLVAISIREQALQERADRIDEDLADMVNGDTDSGQSALTGELVTVYDSSISTAGTMTQRAWIKWLRSDWKRINIDWVLCDLNTFLAIEGRTGRPTVEGNRGTDERLNTIPVAANPLIPATVNVFILEDSSILGANTLVGIDSRKAIQKIVYVGGSYEAVESYVMRRSTAYRFDYSEKYTRMFAGIYNTAWKKLVLATS